MIMDYSVIMTEVAEIIKYAYPIALIFGLSAKFIKFSLDLILDRNINL